MAVVAVFAEHTAQQHQCGNDAEAADEPTEQQQRADERRAAELEQRIQLEVVVSAARKDARDGSSHDEYASKRSEPGDTACPAAQREQHEECDTLHVLSSAARTRSSSARCTGS